MLKLKNVKKTYSVGDESVEALKGIDLNFRRCEFVSILGPSGCGKTTLLNIIGGLDRYTSGELIINGTSTVKFSDRDFDTYRNHSIGFVFQSYNLISHQTVLANVELALTLSGVSRTERRRRAEEALCRVGLKDQMKKKPNQLSGGQMQRVAIARALVNNPDILLADEPTGALDSATSVQVMDILREISREKLVIMVTHNPELAEQYSTRTIRLLDGEVVSDSAPYEGENESVPETEHVKKKSSAKHARGTAGKRSMSFFTALSLSFNNLMTKKARTFLTSFAGSIGIIGIALILSVSTGVNLFIETIQNDTLISYPLTINAESDITSVLASFMSKQNDDNTDRESGYIYSRNVMYDLMDSLESRDTNNLTAFKKFLDGSETVNKYASSIRYTYATEFNVYTKDPTGKIISSDMEDMMEQMSASMGVSYGENAVTSSSSAMMSMASFGVWQEMLPGEDGELINDAIIDSYTVVHGNWPTAYDEAVLVVSDDCEISDYVLYGLGLKPYDEMIEIMKASMMGRDIELTSENRWSFEDIMNTEYRLVYPTERFVKQSDGTYVDISQTEAGLNMLYESRSVPIKIVGIVKPDEDATAAMLTGAVAYTSALTDKLLSSADGSELVDAQLAQPDIDILTGKPFEPEKLPELTDEEKRESFIRYASSLTDDERAELYKEALCTPSRTELDQTIASYLEGTTREELENYIISSYAEQLGVTDSSSLEEYFDELDNDEFEVFFKENAEHTVAQMYREAVLNNIGTLDAVELITLFESTEHTLDSYAAYYELLPSRYSDSTLEANLRSFGYVDKAHPTAVSIYVDTFEDKDMISDAIDEYNASVSEDDRIKYTDYFAIMMSSVSTVLNAISYVLVAFVSISLVVSSIMIGIITYISVLERTKEIGILRAVGASKKDVSRVFNAETLTVGFVSGAFGILISLLLTLPINAIIHYLTGFSSLSARLPVFGAVMLVAISMLLTFIAGLIPSGIASKKDPVVALRSE